MKKLMILLIIPLLLGCSKDNNEFSLISSQKFYITDTEGNDLLNPATENSINTDRIKIYFLIDGKKTEYSQYHNWYVPDTPKGYKIYSPEESNEKQYTILIYLNEKVTKENFSYTYIEFNDNLTDTVKSIVKETSGILSCIMSSYNDSIWSPTANNPTFTIVK